MQKREKVIKRIVSLQRKLFIPMHVETIEELEKRDDIGLMRYLQAHEILMSEQGAINK